MSQILFMAITFFAVVMVIVFLVLFSKYFHLWLRGFTSGSHVGPIRLVLMSLRKVNPHTIIDSRIMAVQAGLPSIPIVAIEAHYLAGGNVRRVVQALIAAQRAKSNLIGILLLRLTWLVEMLLARFAQVSTPK